MTAGDLMVNDGRVTALVPTPGLFVNGAFADSDLGVFAVDDPATRCVIAQVANGGPREARAAIDAATQAADQWAAQSPRARSEVLSRASDLMISRADGLALLICAENGKSYVDAIAEITYAAEFFRWFAEEAVRPGGELGTAPMGGVRNLVTYRPVGVAALVTPWNFPAAMITRKVAPALAAGCTVVLKPAAETPLTALAIAALLREAGLPDGVVNVVPSTDAATVVSTWLEDERVQKLSFTGSTQVGTVLLRQAAERVLNVSMELGGNAPFIVTKTADLEKAVAHAMTAKFRNGGQACTAANRFFVHEDVHDEFISRFGARVAQLSVGPASAGSEVGPLISDKAVGRVSDLVDDALSRGSTISHQSTMPPDLTGYFYPPTILVGVTGEARAVREEIFGPLAPILSWRDEAQLLEQANASEHGLAGYVFADDLKEALRLGEALNVGMVGVNRGSVSDPSAPFGGTKLSGLGREGSWVGVRAFQEAQFLAVDW